MSSKCDYLITDKSSVVYAIVRSIVPQQIKTTI